MTDLPQSSPPSHQALEVPFIDGFLALVEVAAVAFAGSYVSVLVFAVWGVGPLEMLQDARLIVSYLILEASFTLFLIKMLLLWRGGTFASLGWRWSDHIGEIRVGLSCLPFLFLANLVVPSVFTRFFPEHVSVSNPLLELVDSSSALTLFLISSIFVGGIKEETQRAFALFRFENGLGPLIGMIGSRAWGCDAQQSVEMGRRVGLVSGLIVWTVIFGAMHLVQGVDNAVGAGLLGLLFGLVYIWRRNLIAPMVSHSLFNMITLLVVWTSR
jgi:membrane protease YdiL (CAAX protease family)